MYTFALIEMNGIGEPHVIGHYKNINQANIAREAIAKYNRDRVYHVIMLPKAK